MAFEEQPLQRRRAERAQRQKQNKRKKNIKIAVMIIALVLMCAVLGILFLPKLLPMIGIGGSEPTESTVPTQPKPDQVIHLIAGGDVNVTDKTVAAGFGGSGYDYTEVFQDVLPVLSSGDVTMLNFEGIYSGSSYGTATKAAPAELLRALSNAGVDVLQTANSYSIYGGLQGLKSTIAGVQNAGMAPVGTFADQSAFDESGGYLIWEIKGIKVAFVAFTKGMDGMGLPVGSENCVNILYEDYNSTYQDVDEAAITRVVRNAAAHQPDLLVAMLHWGSEFNDQISSTQKKICKLLSAEGVDAIIGTHSHYVQKIETDPETGMLIAYSLGDFYGDAARAGTNYSVLLDLEITKSGATGETRISSFDCIPIYLQEDEPGKLRVLRIREAIIGYESQYLGRVSEETYQAMKTALERIAERTGMEQSA